MAELQPIPGDDPTGGTSDIIPVLLEWANERLAARDKAGCILAIESLYAAISDQREARAGNGDAEPRG